MKKLFLMGFLSLSFQVLALDDIRGFHCNSYTTGQILSIGESGLVINALNFAPDKSMRDYIELRAREGKITDVGMRYLKLSIDQHAIHCQFPDELNGTCEVKDADAYVDLSAWYRSEKYVSMYQTSTNVLLENLRATTIESKNGIINATVTGTIKLDGYHLKFSAGLSFSKTPDCFWRDYEPNKSSN